MDVAAGAGAEVGEVSQLLAMDVGEPAEALGYWSKVLFLPTR